MKLSIICLSFAAILMVSRTSLHMLSLVEESQYMLYHHPLDRKKNQVTGCPLCCEDDDRYFVFEPVHVNPHSFGRFSVTPLFCEITFAWENSRNSHLESVHSLTKHDAALDAWDSRETFMFP